MGSRVVTFKLPPERLAKIVPAEEKPKSRARPKRVPKPKVEKVDEDKLPRSVPKASLGAVNASLRALDKSGNPCRRWTRKQIPIKSFTGFTMELPSWSGGTESSTVYHDKKEESIY